MISYIFHLSDAELPCIGKCKALYDFSSDKDDELKIREGKSWLQLNIQNKLYTVIDHAIFTMKPLHTLIDFTVLTETMPIIQH